MRFILRSLEDSQSTSYTGQVISKHISLAVTAVLLRENIPRNRLLLKGVGNSEAKY